VKSTNIAGFAWREMGTGLKGEVFIKDKAKVASTLFPSNRHHRSNGDCLEGKRENYQICSV